MKDSTARETEQQVPPFSPVGSTPVMNSIQEEDSPRVAQDGFQTPLKIHPESPFSNSSRQAPFTSNSLSRPNSSAHQFYLSKDGGANNSSSSLIYNTSFTFGDQAVAKGSTGESKRNSMKYVPEPQLAPPKSSRSPVRSSSPDARSRRSSQLEAPFNFSSMNAQGNNTYPSRTSFRKGHRYKHSSVSMNFFQEPEVKIPLNIAKSLPIPNFNDMINNLPWPKAYFQLFITFAQCIICIIVFQLGHSKNWNNYLTLSHFIIYDIIGSLIIILVENLSQFQVWSTGTITFPFGLNRIDVLLSFGLAVSLCFVGLDLVFHIVEECIVFFIENANEMEIENEDHDELASRIPHSHHSNNTFKLSDGDSNIWYSVLAINLLFSALSLYKIFYANTNSKLKTKNPVITIVFTAYLFLYPYLFNFMPVLSDHLATVVIAIFILIHGIKIAEWTSTILLMGFSTTALPASSLVHDPYSNEESQTDLKEKKSRKRALSTLPLSSPTHQSSQRSHSLLSGFPSFRKSAINQSYNSTILKSKIKEEVEKLSEFVSRCNLKYEDISIAKINFTSYIALVKLTLEGGSNDDELKVRLAMDTCIKKILPSCETTIEIDRI